jgi:hypothetical protein
MKPIVRKMKTCESPADLRRWIKGVYLSKHRDPGDVNICEAHAVCELCTRARYARPITITIKDGHGKEKPWVSLVAGASTPRTDETTSRISGTTLTLIAARKDETLEILPGVRQASKGGIRWRGRQYQRG